MGDETGAFSWGQRGESRYLKSHLRVKGAPIIYFHRAGHLRAGLDSICKRCPGSSLSVEVLNNLGTSQRALQSLLRKWPEDAKVPSLDIPLPHKESALCSSSKRVQILLLSLSM